MTNFAPSFVAALTAALTGGLSRHVGPVVYRDIEIPCVPRFSLEDAAQAEEAGRRAAKRERNRARFERRQGHHAALLELINSLEVRSCVILTQSDAYKDFVIAMLRRHRPDLCSARLAVFVVSCPTPEAEAARGDVLPDFAASLPVYRAPGLAVARERWSKVQAAATEAALAAEHAAAVEEAERRARERVLAGKAAASVQPGLEERLATCEHVLAELLDWFAGSFNRSSLHTPAQVERAKWLIGLHDALASARSRR